MRLIKMRLTTLLALLAALHVAPATAGPPATPSEAGKCRFWERRGPETVDLTIQRKTGQVFKGPRVLQLQPINRLRYDVVIGNEVVTEKGPNLSLLKFIPGFPTEVKTEAKEAATKVAAAMGGIAGTDVPTNTKLLVQGQRAEMLEAVPESELARYKRSLDLFERELATQPLSGLIEWAKGEGEDLGIQPVDVVELVFARLQAELTVADTDLAKLRANAITVAKELESSGKRLEDLILRSDQLLANDPDASTIVAAIGPVKDQITLALNAAWPETEPLEKKLAAIGAELEKMPFQLMEFQTWFLKCDETKGVCNRGRYGGAKNDLEGLSKALSGYAKGSDPWKAQTELRTHLQDWLPLLGGLTEDSFRKVITVDCDYPFFDSRTTKLEVKLTDRLEKDKTKATQTLQVAEVVCPSHFAVTAGIGVAWIDERDIAFVEAPAPPADEPDEAEVGENPPPEENGLTKVFGFDNKSSEQINPTFLIHTRLTNCPTTDVHLSAGTVLDFDRPADSSVFGYLAGVSLSVKERLFMTLGVQAQRVPELAGGFEIGDEVPADLTAPPFEQDWKFGAVFAVTYKMN